MTNQGSARPFRAPDIALAAAVMAVVSMMVVPLPPWLLDILLTFSMGASLVILLVSIFTAEPLQFSAFPALLLVVTLFRLSLNVSSTRLLLLTGEAGNVIRRFGEFVVGGNTAVGLIIFLILTIVNFVVITRGAERVSEVAARFTLDAMPGKQMAIDADLNAGLIDEATARARREAINREADFYGAMDGASKFVKGDAIAGLIILAINIVGGFIVGVVQQDMSFSEAWQHYSLRTVGDGLVTQIPALMVSTATGLVVTRAAGESGLGQELAAQLLADPHLPILAGVALIILGLVPGMPTVVFLTVGAALAAMGYILQQRRRAAELAAAAQPQPLPVTEEVPPESAVQLSLVDPLEIELGYGLVPLADAERGGDLLDRVVAVRRQVALNLGLLLPYIRVRDNLALNPYQYTIKLRGIEVGSYELMPDRLLAMAPGEMEERIPGQETVEPAFGLPGVWISPADRQRAELMGYTVVDPVSVLIAHLTEVIKEHAAELLGRQEVRKMVDMVRETHPALVEELTPSQLTLGEIQKVLQNLLSEGVPIRDLVLIFETLADWAGTTRNPEQLTEHVRVALGRTILHTLGVTDKLRAITLAPDLEQRLLAAGERKPGEPGLDPALAQNLVSSVQQQAQAMAEKGMTPILVCAPALRPMMRRVAQHAYPKLAVLSYAELDPKLEIEPVGVVRG
ncbi:MAG TPA: flagellar biosynthesis protein FlhA [Symbiobacteriaceae bacterium]